MNKLDLPEANGWPYVRYDGTSVIDWLRVAQCAHRRFAANLTDYIGEHATMVTACRLAGDRIGCAARGPIR